MKSTGMRCFSQEENNDSFAICAVTLCCKRNLIKRLKKLKDYLRLEIIAIMEKTVMKIIVIILVA